jgi:hypothetical protein
LLNRWRGRSREGDVVPQQANTTATEISNASDQASDEIGGRAVADDGKSHDPEKPPHKVNTSGEPPVIDVDAEDEADLPEDIRQLPRIVRSIVSLEDDPNAPTITFRYFLLCFLFVPPGAILFQMGIFRTTASAYPVLFVQIGRSILLVVLFCSHRDSFTLRRTLACRNPAQKDCPGSVHEVGL